jgi:hypothetical protein
VVSSFVHRSLSARPTVRIRPFNRTILMASVVSHLSACEASLRSCPGTPQSSSKPSSAPPPGLELPTSCHNPQLDGGNDLNLRSFDGILAARCAPHATPFLPCDHHVTSTSFRAMHVLEMTAQSQFCAAISTCVHNDSVYSAGQSLTSIDNWIPPTPLGLKFGQHVPPELMREAAMLPLLPAPLHCPAPFVPAGRLWTSDDDEE